MDKGYLDRIGMGGTDCGESLDMDRICDLVAKEINFLRPKWYAAAEFFNGVLSVEVNGVNFTWGTANQTWGADVYLSREALERGDQSTSFDTGVARGAPAHKVAEAIVAAVGRYMAARDFLAKMEAFRQAAQELSEAWEKLSVDDTAARLLVDKYPFKESFDDLYLGILEWVDTVHEDDHFGVTYVKRSRA